MKRLTPEEIHRDKHKDRRPNTNHAAKASTTSEGARAFAGLRGDTRKRLVPRVSRPALKENGRVRVEWCPSYTGKIVRLGPEQSLVRLDIGKFQVFINEHLEPWEEK